MADEANENFPDERAVMKRYEADPSEANRMALVKLRFDYAAALANEAQRTRDGMMYARALRCAQDALRIDQKNPAAWALGGRIYSGMRHGRVAQMYAEEAFREALALSEDPGVRLLLGQTLFYQEPYKASGRLRAGPRRKPQRGSTARAGHDLFGLQHRLYHTPSRHLPPLTIPVGNFLPFAIVNLQPSSTERETYHETPMAHHPRPVPAPHRLLRLEESPF